MLVGYVFIHLSIVCPTKGKARWGWGGGDRTGNCGSRRSHVLEGEWNSKVAFVGDFVTANLKIVVLLWDLNLYQ